jgi:hypothetical protein
MSNVKANRVIGGATEQGRQQAPLDASTNKITADASVGWSLIYSKGHEGEQQEFVQALGHAKQVFGGALEARRRMVSARHD